MWTFFKRLLLRFIKDETTTAARAATPRAPVPPADDLSVPVPTAQTRDASRPAEPPPSPTRHVDPFEKMTGAFVHLNRRLFSRYAGLHIDWPTYQAWTRRVWNGQSEFVCERRRGTVHMIDHEGREVFVVVLNETIITALPPRDRYQMALAQQREERAPHADTTPAYLLKRPGKQKARLVGKGDITPKRAGRPGSPRPAGTTPAREPAPTFRSSQGAGKARQVGVGDLDALFRRRRTNDASQPETGKTE